MLGRLNFVFIWAGYIALVTFYALITFALVTKAISIDEVFEEIIVIAATYPPEIEFLFAWFWLGHLYWPIRWITTGERSLLPWIENEDETYD